MTSEERAALESDLATVRAELEIVKRNPHTLGDLLVLHMEVVMLQNKLENDGKPFPPITLKTHFVNPPEKK